MSSTCYISSTPPYFSPPCTHPLICTVNTHMVNQRNTFIFVFLSSRSDFSKFPKFKSKNDLLLPYLVTTPTSVSPSVFPSPTWVLAMRHLASLSTASRFSRSHIPIYSDLSIYPSRYCLSKVTGFKFAFIPNEQLSFNSSPIKEAPTSLSLMLQAPNVTEGCHLLELKQNCHVCHFCAPSVCAPSAVVLFQHFNIIINIIYLAQ